MKIKSSFVLGFLLTLAAVFAMSSLGCSSGGDDDPSPTTNTVLPSTLMVTVPKSLASGGSQQSMRALRSVTDDRAQEAYWTIKGGVQEMKGNGASMAIFGAGIDELISSKGLSPSSAEHKDLTITMTQALKDKMKNFAEAGGFDVDEMLGELNGDVPVPPFIYNTASAPYSFSVKMTQTDEDGTYYTAFYWSSDKKKVKMAFADADLDVNAAAATYSYTITYDDSTKTSSIVSEDTYGGQKNTFTFSLKEDTASTKNGAFVFYEGSYTDTETYYQSGSGYADDAGGSLKVTVRYGTGANTKVENYETAFDATTINAGLTDDYSGYVDQIDETMYTEVGNTEGMSGGTSDYSVDTRVYTLTGVTVDTNWEDQNYTSYIIFDRALTAPTTGSSSIDSASVNTGSAEYVGSGYGSAAGELTAFLEVGSTGTGYVYCVIYDGVAGTSTWKYQGTVTL